MLVKLGDTKKKGVFATRMIRRHERVCFYAGKDMIADNCKDVNNSMKHPLKKGIVRYGNKYVNGYHLGVAQLMNDGAVLMFGIHENKKYSPQIIRSCEKLIKEYVKLSKEKSNMSLEPRTFWFCSSRQIEKGEELYYHYGPLYWLRKMYDEVAFNDWRVILHFLINRFGGDLPKLVITY